MTFSHLACAGRGHQQPRKLPVHLCFLSFISFFIKMSNFYNFIERRTAHPHPLLCPHKLGAIQFLPLLCDPSFYVSTSPFGHLSESLLPSYWGIQPLIQRPHYPGLDLVGARLKSGHGRGVQARYRARLESRLACETSGTGL